MTESEFNIFLREDLSQVSERKVIEGLFSFRRV